MDIVGIGSHILECVRVRKLIDRHAEVFLRQVYTEAEIRFCHSRSHTTEQFTAFWAAKEAVLRSLGLIWRRGMAWTDVEILCGRDGPPTVEVKGALRERMDAVQVNGFRLTMAHCRAYATATCLAIKNAS